MAYDLSQLDPSYLAGLDQRNAQQQLLMDQLRRSEALSRGPERYGAAGGIAQAGADILNAANSNKLLGAAWDRLQQPGAGQTGLGAAQTVDAVAQARQRSAQAAESEDKLAAVQTPEYATAQRTAGYAFGAPAGSLDNVPGRVLGPVNELYEKAQAAKERNAYMQAMMGLRWGGHWTFKDTNSGAKVATNNLTGEVREVAPDGGIGPQVSPPLRQVPGMPPSPGSALPQTMGAESDVAPPGPGGSTRAPSMLPLSNPGAGDPELLKRIAAIVDERLANGTLKLEGTTSREDIINAMASGSATPGVDVPETPAAPPRPLQQTLGYRDAGATPAGQQPEPEQPQEPQAPPSVLTRALGDKGFRDAGASDPGMPEPTSQPVPYQAKQYDMRAQRFGKGFDLDHATGEVGANKRRLDAADRVLTLLTDKATGQPVTSLTHINSSEAAAAVASLIASGSQAALGTIQRLEPHTLGLDFAKAAEYLTGRPKLVTMPGFVKLFADIALREKGTLGAQLDQSVQRGLAGNRDFLDHNFSQAQASARDAGYELSRKWNGKSGQYEYSTKRTGPIGVVGPTQQSQGQGQPAGKPILRTIGNETRQWNGSQWVPVGGQR